MIYLLILISCLYLLSTNKRYRWFYIIYKTFRRDFRALRTNTTVVKAFKQLVHKHPDKVAIYFEEQAWTYKQLDEFSNKVGTYFKNAGYQEGDTIALFLNGKPEYVGIWLGLAKIRVVTALINTNLTKDPLLHSIRAAKAKAFIYGSELLNVVNDVMDQIPQLAIFEFIENIESSTATSGRINLRSLLDHTEIESLAKYYSRGCLTDKLLYIYTSGTTGLPKAAVITNNRFIFLAQGMYIMIALQPSDVLYDPLPLYHTAGGIVGAGLCINNGITIVLRKKFSARNYWKDCNKYKCTVAQYIGEICRYLLAVPSATDDENKTVRKIVGNGLKAQIWEKFVKRFNIDEVYEIYGSTEGNSNLINLDSKVGSIGFVPRYGAALHPVQLIKCDDNGVAIRNGNGHCIPCHIGEPGLFIGQIDHKKVIYDFVGYADEQATSNKILRNVFNEGDLYFNSGDVLIQDEFGYYYFKDRTGDTFRWKGENVATSEVEAVISNIVNLNDAVVYGVEIPNTDGRAGMAAIVDTDGQMNLERFSKEIVKNLPNYALPIFLRIMNELPLTGTFKLKKVDLQNEAFDINKIQDDLYVFDFKERKYVELTHQVHQDIITGKLRL